MKTELKLKTDTIVAINSILQLVYTIDSQATNIQEKIYKSIGFELADKIDNKLKSIIKKGLLHNSKIKHKITLKYHEGWAMYNIITNFLPLELNHLYRVLLQKTADELHQNL